MTEIETLVLDINNQFKPVMHFSMDMYYDDLQEKFVVRLSNMPDDLEKVKHFRNDRLPDSLLDCYNFLKSAVEDNGAGMVI